MHDHRTVDAPRPRLRLLQGGGESVLAWEAQFERALGEFIKSRLHDDPPPGASQVADDLELWGDRLIMDAGRRDTEAAR